MQAKPLRAQIASVLSQLSVTVPPLGPFYCIGVGKQNETKFIRRKNIDFLKKILLFNEEKKELCFKSADELALFPPNSLLIWAA